MSVFQNVVQSGGALVSSGFLDFVANLSYQIYQCSYYFGETTAINFVSYFQQAIPWMILFSLLIFGMIVYLRIAANAAKDWPFVPGKITTSRVSYERIDGDTNETPFVVYVYEVDGKTYKAGNISPGILTLSNAEKVVARYPVGSAVTVYYNPKNPSQAVLEKNSQAQIGGMCGVLIFGNLLIPIAVLLYDIVFKR